MLFSGRNIWPGEALCEGGGTLIGVPCVLLLVGILCSGILGDGTMFVEGRVFGEDLYVPVEIGNEGR